MIVAFVEDRADEILQLFWLQEA